MIALLLGVLMQVSVQMGVTVKPDTVTVGQHFVATVYIRAPKGAVIRFPTSPITPAIVDTAGPALRRDTTTASYIEARTAYLLAAWDTGRVKLSLGTVSVELPSGERQIPLSEATVYVKSVLPADTALRKPKPARSPLLSNVFNWLPWVIGALIALLLLAVLWWLWRKYRHRSLTPVPSIEWAEHEFQRIEAMQLLQHGQVVRYAILMTGVVRQYLIREYPVVRASATTRELALGLRNEPTVPFDDTLGLFERVDLLKFAHQSIVADEARQIGAESREIVQRIDSVKREEEARRAAAAQAAGASPAVGEGRAA